MNHKQKVKLAKRMSKTKEERAKKTPLFQTKEWERRKGSKIEKELQAMHRKEVREIAAKALRITNLTEKNEDKKTKDN